jgi:hypothetical protein
MVGGKAVAYLYHDGIGSPVHVCRGEAEQTKSGPDEAILPAVVIHQPVAVVGAVVFDHQVLAPIKQVWAAQETSSVVMDGNLNLWPRKSGEDEKHPKPGLHWGLGLRLGQINNVPEPSDSLSTRMLRGTAAELCDRHQPRMQEHVRNDNSLEQRLSADEVNDRTECGRGRKATPSHDFLTPKGGAPNDCAGTPAATD